METLSLIQPDDWHVHVREGAMLRAVLPFTADVFARAVVMPNLRSPITTAARAKAYRDDILVALPPGKKFTPLMTLYLTDETDADDLERGYRDGILFAAKLYPAHATTNAERGVSDIKHIYPALTRLQHIGMPLLVHGESVDPDIDIFDREAVFIERVLTPLRRDFPALKIVLEHITTEEAAAYVEANGKAGTLAATLTAHHLFINRNALFQGGLRPHAYCLPIAKREKHRKALVKAATSGAPMFFLGTDSAPHPDEAKLSACGCAGIFTAPHALGLYAQCFENENALDKLEAFASRNGAVFHGLALNEAKILLQKAETIEIKPILTEDEHNITPFLPPHPLSWRMA